MQKIISIPQPVIAEVPGIAAAAGCQLVATCDLAIASEKAEFMTPGVNIGLFCSTPMVAVSRNVSRKKMMEMLLMGEKMSAIEAEKYGLVNKIVPEKTLSEKSNFKRHQLIYKKILVNLRMQDKLTVKHKIRFND